MILINLIYIMSKYDYFPTVSFMLIGNLVLTVHLKDYTE